jgi:hypothetical protein
MASSKRPRNDENSSFSFVDSSTSLPKRIRCSTQSISLAEIQNLQAERAAKDARDARLIEDLSRKAAEEKQRGDLTSRVRQVLESMTAAGYDSLYAFVDELLNIRDQQLSARVSRMLGRHVGGPY